MYRSSINSHSGRRSLVLMLGGSAGLVAASALPAPVGNAVNGKQVFAQCNGCHAVVPGQNRAGPSLAGIVGRPAASVPGYTYSAALKASRIVWIAPVLSAYLEAPQKAVAGTKMGYAGLADPQKRADVIAYLKSKPAS